MDVSELKEELSGRKGERPGAWIRSTQAAAASCFNL